MFPDRIVSIDRVAFEVRGTEADAVKHAPYGDARAEHVFDPPAQTHSARLTLADTMGIHEVPSVTVQPPGRAPLRVVNLEATESSRNGGGNGTHLRSAEQLGRGLRWLQLGVAAVFASPLGTAVGAMAALFPTEAGKGSDLPLKGRIRSQQATSAYTQLDASDGAGIEGRPNQRGLVRGTQSPPHDLGPLPEAVNERIIGGGYRAQPADSGWHTHPGKTRQPSRSEYLHTPIHTQDPQDHLLLAEKLDPFEPNPSFEEVWQTVRPFTEKERLARTNVRYIPVRWVSLSNPAESSPRMDNYPAYTILDGTHSEVQEKEILIVPRYVPYHSIQALDAQGFNAKPLNAADIEHVTEMLRFGTLELSALGETPIRVPSIGGGTTYTHISQAIEWIHLDNFSEGGSGQAFMDRYIESVGIALAQENPKLVSVLLHQQHFYTLLDTQNPATRALKDAYLQERQRVSREKFKIIEGGKPN